MATPSCEANKLPGQLPVPDDGRSASSGVLYRAAPNAAPLIRDILGEFMKIRSTIACLAALYSVGVVMRPQTNKPSAEYRGRPHLGRPQVIPGRIQAEFYDAGGEGIAYHDSDPGNNGSGKLNMGTSDLDQFRKDEDVDISYTKKAIDKTVEGQEEAPGELYVGWTTPGEWVKYTVEVKQAGVYSVNAHLSSNNQNAENQPRIRWRRAPRVHSYPNHRPLAPVADLPEPHRG
jgi:hypothetical protein